MNKIGIIGDIHLRMSEKYGRYDSSTGLNTRLTEKLNYLKEAISTFINEKVHTVIFLGDIFDTINPSERLRSLFFDIISPLIRQFVHVYIILGNHEVNLVNLHSFMTVKSLDITYITIVDDILMTPISGMFFVPYGKENELKDIDPSQFLENSILFGHMRIKPYFEDGIDLEFLKKHFNLIRNGHYHIPDEIHTGSLCVYRRDEIDTDHRYEIFDVDKNKVRIFPIIGEDKFFKLNTDIKDLEDIMESGFFELEESNGLVVDIKIKDTKENLETISVKSLKRSIKNAEMVIISKEVIPDTENRTVGTLSKNFNLEDDIVRYCNNNERTDMIECGKNILKEINI